jgi:uncharacterized protein (TIGR02147 family)
VRIARPPCYAPLVSEPNPLPDLFSYLDYRAFIRDWFEARKAVDPSLTHRSFVQAAGMRSPSVLINVLAGARNLSPESTESFAAALGLDDDERGFFRALVAFGQATTDEDRNEALAIVSAERRFRSARRLEGEAFRFLSHWYLPAVHQLANRSDFRADPVWIAASLRPQIRVEEAEQALDSLRTLGLLAPAADGELTPVDESIVTARELEHLAACNYHREMTQRAYDAVASFGPSERHLLGVTIAVPSGLVPQLKAELNRFQARILDLADAAEAPADRVFQVNLQLVPLSDVRGEAS